MLVSVSDDLRVLLISLSVACTYIQSLEKVNASYRMRLCRHALNLFAPVAARLGIYALKYRLERSSFPECYPTDADHISRQLALLHEEHGAFLQRTASSIRTFLDEQRIVADVVAREKQPYSIFQKMQDKSVTSLTKITDLFAIRVIVPTLQDCYQTLGFLHKLATPISHRFKDYISFPKPNGYQSLHTCLLGLPHAPKDVMVEVQIRTYDMHEDAEYGIASHWMYKERRGFIQGQKLPRLPDMLSQRKIASADDVGGESTPLRDRIYVLTPQGDIIELPDASTPLDFAFVLHTELGLRFKAAKVNGNIVPLSYALENGDVVEILTHKFPRPTLQWLEELTTASARAKLKTYFFSKNRAQFLSKGRSMVNAELKARQLPLLDNDLSALRFSDGEMLSLHEREDLLVKVGMGSVRTSSVLRHAAQPTAERPLRALRNTSKKKSAAATTPDRPVLGIVGSALTMPYRFAKCCAVDKQQPHPRLLIGIVNRSGTITVHKADCGMVKGSNRERRLEMYWKSEESQ